MGGTDHDHVRRLNRPGTPRGNSAWSVHLIPVESVNAVESSVQLQRQDPWCHHRGAWNDLVETVHERQSWRIPARGVQHPCRHVITTSWVASQVGTWLGWLSWSGSLPWAATIQNALRELREEGLIVSRQGSGVFVRERTERPVGLRPQYVEQARTWFDSMWTTVATDFVR